MTGIISDETGGFSFEQNFMVDRQLYFIIAQAVWIEYNIRWGQNTFRPQHHDIRKRGINMAGTIYGVGVGPGDPELLTLKAVRSMQSCDVIGIPAGDKDSCTAYQIAVQAVPEIAQKQIVAVTIPMTTDAERLEKAYAKGCADLKRELEQGKNIAFLNLGDPTIYASYMEIHKRLADAGFHAELISGVPSFCAVAATLGIPLGSGKEEIHILPGCYDDEIGRYKGTTILMKSGGRIGTIKEKLAGMEQRGQISAYAVSDCGMESQVVYSDICQVDEQSGYFTTIIVKEEA